MSGIPDEWVEISTNESFKQISTSNKKVKTKECLSNGRFPVVDQGQELICGYIDAKKKLIEIDKPVVIFGDHTRIIKWIEFNFVPGADGTKVLLPNENLNNRFFYYQLKSIQLIDKGYARHFKLLKESSFKLPPLPEQNEMASRLEQLLGQVDRIKSRIDGIPAILKRFRHSVLSAAVSGKLTEDWREENDAKPISFTLEKIENKRKGLLKVRQKKGMDDSISLFKIPNNWCWIKAYRLAEDSTTSICAGPFGTIFKAKDFRDKGIPIIFLRHVKEEGFNQRKPNYMDIEVWKEYHQDYSVFGGELLITKLGEPPGESCIFPKDFGKAMVTPDILKMNVDNQVAITKYLMYFFNSINSKKMLSELAFGATRLRIDIAMFKNFPAPTPPLEEQKEIVKRVESCFALADSIENKVKEAQKRVDSLAQSILAKAFSGELTREWRKMNEELISGENSAEALLEKIASASLSDRKGKKQKK